MWGALLPNPNDWGSALCGFLTEGGANQSAVEATIQRGETVVLQAARTLPEELSSSDSPNVIQCEITTSTIRGIAFKAGDDPSGNLTVSSPRVCGSTVSLV